MVVMRHSKGLSVSLKNFDELRSQWRAFHDHMNAFQESAYKKHVPDERQLQKYVGFEEIALKYKEISIDRGTITQRESQDIVLLSIILSTPPKRADFGMLRVHYEKEPNTPKENYIVLRSDSPSYITLNVYKTDASYARVDTELPPNTAKDIKDSMRRWPRTYLFESRLGKPFSTKNAYSKYIQSTFKRLFGRKTGVTMLRHIYITEKLDFGKLDDDELEEVAHQMLHSTTLQRKYNWKKESVCQSIATICGINQTAKIHAKPKTKPIAHPTKKTFSKITGNTNPTTKSNSKPET
jgi:hypothetical protein